MAAQTEDAKKQADEFRRVYDAIHKEVSRVIVGQEEVIESVLTALLAGGHVILEGVPGLGKTLLVRSLGDAIQVDFSRIQFTPDMMPADIQGTQVLVDSGNTGQHKLEFRQGPLVAHLVLADEINRATPKTQSALLEAMQERQITVGSHTIQLEEPYCVMATQNPVEQEGTYPLPEAQLDRFLFKVIVGYPKVAEYAEILDRTTGTASHEAQVVSSAQEIVAMREVVRAVPVPQHAQDYAIHLVVGTQPGSEFAAPAVNENVALGSSPRGVQGLILASKVKALLDGRFAVSCGDIRDVAHEVLRHRVLINFHGQADGVTPDQVVSQVVEHVPMPHEQG